VALELTPEGDIRALYQLDPQSVEVVVSVGEAHSAHQTVRITAKRRLPNGDFCAAYEERIEMDYEGTSRMIWAEAEFPWADGATAEECLGKALRLVSSAGVRDL
jgi:hypothetical protein